MTNLLIDVSPDADEMARRAAEKICAVLSAPDAVGAVCLSGGNTPRGLYELLSRTPYAERVPWSRIQWFFGDERFVPQTDARSNFRMAQDAMFGRAPVSPERVHAVPTTGLDVEAAASKYQSELQAFYGGDVLRPDKPLFDVVVLGLGPDGHTASLLPGQDQQYERVKWAVAARAGAPEPRVTLTVPVLESARLVAFLISGADKRKALAQLRSGADIPAARIKPSCAFVAFVDAAAVG